MLDIIVQQQGVVMRYCYEVRKDKNYLITSKQFPLIKGNGPTEDRAFEGFITKVFNHIKDCFKNELRLPDGYEITSKKSKTFGLPLNMALKIKLHNTRLSKKVSRTELARLLSITYDEVSVGNWDIQSLRAISSVNVPKYKNVQRLFDIDHDSTVREIEHAYRVLGCNVDITPYERN